ncbi:MAG: chaperone protein DnaJ [Candidatus Sericytochromatia bacterium]|nr:MAG: chaperone protein DnaJ [Candidatus Sericytochromatia bacterium]
MNEINYKDYYSILGLEKNCSEEQIKSAFRTLVRKYHPDINSDTITNSKVKDIIEAYEVLSDKEKRKSYDYIIDSLSKKGIKSFQSKSNLNKEKSKSFNFNEIFSNIVGNLKEGTINTVKKFNNIEKDICISIYEAYNGSSKNIIITNEENCKKCNSTGKYLDNICLECQGKGFIIIKNNIKIEIPKNTLPKDKLEIKSQGYGSGITKGDLILNIKVEEHPFFKLDSEGNISCELPITVTEAILGAEIEVPTLKGPIKMKIPPGTQNGTIFRLKERGFYNKEQNKIKCQYVKINILIPKNLSNKEKQLYNELAIMEKIYPREKIYEVVYGKNK